MLRSRCSYPSQRRKIGHEWSQRCLCFWICWRKWRSVSMGSERRYVRPAMDAFSSLRHSLWNGPSPSWVTSCSGKGRFSVSSSDLPKWMGCRRLILCHLQCPGTRRQYRQIRFTRRVRCFECPVSRWTRGPTLVMSLIRQCGAFPCRRTRHPATLATR